MIFYDLIKFSRKLIYKAYFLELAYIHFSFKILHNRITENMSKKGILCNNALFISLPMILLFVVSQTCYAEHTILRSNVDLSNLHMPLVDSTKVCDDLDCTNGLETWDALICKCIPGIPPSPCSDCYENVMGSACEDGDTLTIHDTWQEEETFYMRYKVELVIIWDSLSTGWPDQNAHFSFIGGATHNADVKFWEVGTLASPGIDQMAINGGTYILEDEVTAAIGNGTAQNSIQEQRWFCTDGINHPSCGDLFFDVFITPEYPLISLVSMLGPSPDWFIGVESLSLIDSSGSYIPQVVLDLFPYDAGILSDNNVMESDCCEREPLSVPQDNIHLITEESGELIGPESLGKIIFTAYPDPADCVCVSGGIDADGDGYTSEDDCDDTNASINPDQIEIAYNGFDDDCDSLTFDDDLDQDGFVLIDDCDDTNDNINPGQIETIYNGIDDDCDPTTLDDDLDQDGFDIIDDCNDDNPAINPEAIEIANNGIDEDCDGDDLISSVHALGIVEVHLFPNPVTEKLKIYGIENIDSKIELYDLSGRLVFSIRNTTVLDLHSLTNGSYLLKVSDIKNNKHILERITIAR